MKRVLLLQGKRETTHFLFDRGLSEYLAEAGKPNAGNFEQYKLVAHEVTESFKGRVDSFLSSVFVRAGGVRVRARAYVRVWGGARAWG